MIIGRYALINTRLRACKKTIQYRGRARAAVVEPQIPWSNCCYHGRRPVVTGAGRTSSRAGETVTLSVTRASPKSLPLIAATVGEYFILLFRSAPLCIIVNGFFCFRNVQQSKQSRSSVLWRRPCRTIRRQ